MHRISSCLWVPPIIAANKYSYRFRARISFDLASDRGNDRLYKLQKICRIVCKSGYVDNQSCRDMDFFKNLVRNGFASVDLGYPLSAIHCNRVCIFSGTNELSAATIKIPVILFPCHVHLLRALHPGSLDSRKALCIRRCRNSSIRGYSIFHMDSPAFRRHLALSISETKSITTSTDGSNSLDCWFQETVPYIPNDRFFFASSVLVLAFLYVLRISQLVYQYRCHHLF
mmetsp:Transcript_30189/g.45739  ORF Transcript_30189/g.45739 Transcript_30189/m.45739 type:complete len:228 (+) Transcript_30189:358-1041(+)